MNFKILVLAALLVSCGDNFNEDKFPTSEEFKETSNEVTYSGYVQKAFEITVNGTKFGDSEQFYTDFIEKLVKPTYGDLADATVTIEGAYGMDEFGSSSSVFMAPTIEEGDLFEAVTDQHSKFTITVLPQAIGEMYKARVIIRIGLVVVEGTEVNHFCYVLYGLTDGIKLEDQAKPVVFNSFRTQLNTYQCDKVESNKLVIPSFRAPDKTPFTPIPTDTGTISTSTGTVSAQ